MYKLFSRLRAWLDAVTAIPAAPDPLAALSARELADLPPLHPRSEPRCN